MNPFMCFSSTINRSTNEPVSQSISDARTWLSNTATPRFSRRVVRPGQAGASKQQGGMRKDKQQASRKEDIRKGRQTGIIGRRTGGREGDSCTTHAE